MKKTTTFNQRLLRSFRKNTSASKKLLLTFIGFVFLLSACATNYTATTSGNWNSAATWGGSGFPAAGDNATIPSGITVTVVTNTPAVCSGITINGTLTLNADITVNGAWVFNSGAGVNYSQTSRTVIFGTGGSIGGSAASTFRNLEINTANATDVVTLLSSGASVTNSSGGGVLTLNQGIFNIGTGNTLNMTGGGGGNAINNPNATGTSNFATTGANGADGGTVNFTSGNPVTINGPGATTFFNLSSSANTPIKISTPNLVLINGTVSIRTNSTGLNLTTNSPIYGPASTLFIDYAGQGYTQGVEWLSLTSGTIGVTPGYPNNVTITNIGTSQGGFHNGNGWVPNANLAINGVLTLGNNITNAQVDFSNVPSLVCGGFVLNTNSRFTAPKATMTVNGNWTDNQPLSGTTKGFFINGTSTVLFGGTGTCSSPNTITCSSGNSETFYNLSINNDAFVSLNSPVTVTSTLNLMSGIFSTSAANTISVTNTNTSAILGGSANTYIDGPVKWSLQAAIGSYLFPVGAGGCTNTYLPFTLNKLASDNPTVTVQAFNVGTGGTTDGTLSSLSPTEYWALATTPNITGGYGVSVSRPTPVDPYIYVAYNIGGLPNGSNYHSASGLASGNSVINSDPIGSGSLFYITLGAPPIVSTLAATSITTTGATLNGAFNTQGSSLPTSFNYGTTTVYGSTVTTIHTPINSNSSVPDSAIITGLTANTSYDYMATDGANSGSDVIFITAPNPPIIGAPTNPTAVGFTANWSAPAVPGTAPYTYAIEVSSDPNFTTGVITQAGIPSGTTSFMFTTLSSATQYFYRVEAVNATANSAWSATSTGISTDIVPTSACTTGTGSTTSTGSITKATTLPVIDGQPDPVWDNVPANNISFVSVPANTGNTQTWKAMWSADSLYFLIQVNDPTPISQNLSLTGSVPVAGATASTSGNYYGSDGVEIALAPDGVLNNSYNGYNDIQLRFNLGSTIPSGQSYGGPNQFQGNIFLSVYQHVDFKVILTSTGYNVEAAIPLNPGIDSLQSGGYFTTTNAQNIGLEVQVNDATNTSGRAAQYSWFNGSSNPYQDPSTFASATYTTCPVPPIVILPTVTNITDTSAVLGATVTSSGDNPLIANGTGYTTNPNNTGEQNALHATTVVIPTATFTTPRTGLAPQTKYYFLGYAQNSDTATGVSNVDSFYTLSALPTIQPTLSAATCSGVILNWGTVNFPSTDSATQTGYIILRRQDGTDPTTTGITNRIATVQSALPSGTTLVTTINSGSTITYTDATAVQGTAYNYLLVPFTWDGTSADSTYNYFITGAPTKAATIGTLTTPAIIYPNTSICSGAAVDPLPTPTNGITGSWSPATVSNTVAQTYTFTPDAGQCAKDTSITINIKQPSPVPTVDNTSIAYCQGATATVLSATGQSLKWYSDTTVASIPAPTPSTSAAGNTTYYVSQTVAGSCGESYKVPIVVTVAPTPKIISVSTNPSPATIAPNTPITLIATTDVAGASYTWANALGFGSNDSAAVVPSPVTGYYTIKATLGDNPACSDTAGVGVTVQPLVACQTHPRKAFTPNGDGYNDTWKIFEGDCQPLAVVDIYNRWGSLVYHSGSYNDADGWDGKYKGSRLPDGTYYYVIQVTQTGSAVPSTLTGNVTIIR